MIFTSEHRATFPLASDPVRVAEAIVSAYTWGFNTTFMAVEPPDDGAKVNLSELSSGTTPLFSEGLTVVICSADGATTVSVTSYSGETHSYYSGFWSTVTTLIDDAPRLLRRRRAARNDEDVVGLSSACVFGVVERALGVSPSAVEQE